VNSGCPEGDETIDSEIEVCRIFTKYKNLAGLHITVERDAQENKKQVMKNLDNSI
jgi:hypothetical protein